jgi:hypothetical protein
MRAKKKVENQPKRKRRTMLRKIGTFGLVVFLSIPAFAEDQAGSDDTRFGDGHTDQVRAQKQKIDARKKQRSGYGRSGERSASESKGQLRGGPATTSGSDTTDLDPNRPSAGPSATPGVSDSTGQTGRPPAYSGSNTPGAGPKGGSASDNQIQDQ